MTIVKTSLNDFFIRFSEIEPLFMSRLHTNALSNHRDQQAGRDIYTYICATLTCRRCTQSSRPAETSILTFAQLWHVVFALNPTKLAEASILKFVQHRHVVFALNQTVGTSRQAETYILTFVKIWHIVFALNKPSGPTGSQRHLYLHLCNCDMSSLHWVLYCVCTLNGTWGSLSIVEK